jgi:Rrf2 family protein
MGVNLRLSKRGDYVVRSAICLARAYPSDRPTKLREVSAETGVPRTYVSQILGDLVRAEVAVSSAGLHGGYRLARPPAAISLLEVVEAGEGSLVAESCALGDGPSRWEEIVPLHDAWRRASQALRDELAVTTLAELAEADRSIETGAHRAPADAQRHRVAAVAVADSVHVELPAAAVAARLQEGDSWMAPHVAAAAADVDAFRLRVGPGGPSWLGKTVAVRLGRPERAGDGVRVAIVWEATGASALFPRFEGTLDVVDLDPERCEVSLLGRYRPPLGRAGQALDDVLLGRVARATVRSLLRRVAHGLEQAPAATADLEPAPVPEGPPTFSEPQPAGAAG